MDHLGTKERLNKTKDEYSYLMVAIECMHRISRTSCQLSIMVMMLRSRSIHCSMVVIRVEVSLVGGHGVEGLWLSPKINTISKEPF